jgi:hypothetical protein
MSNVEVIDRHYQLAITQGPVRRDVVFRGSFFLEARTSLEEYKSG